jgi:ribosome-binding ATPase YchF (GTP1/OBG family)
VAKVEAVAADVGGTVIAMCAQIEAEIAALDAEEAGAFLAELGLDEPTVNRVARAAFGLLDLITFFTVGEKEVRSWVLRRGGNAVEAAGKIHTDIARGFIRAEVISTDDLLAAGSHAEAARQGKQRLEGKEYLVLDGDTLNVRFNV